MKCTTISDALFLPENAETLRVILKEKEDELLSIRDDVDSPLEERALRPLLVEVAGEVNSLLDSNFGLPSIICDSMQKSSGYLPSKMEIQIGHGEMLLNDIYALIAHEFMHHVAKICWNPGSDWYRNRALEEGMARGVEMKIAGIYSLKFDSSSFKKKALMRICKDLTEFMGKLNGNERSANKGADPGLDSFNFSEENLGKYKYGTSALLLAERMHGDIVYRRLIKSTRPYRLLVGFLSGDVKL